MSLFEEVVKKFETVEKKLKSNTWFKKDKWTVSIHGFPEKNPDAVTLHASKPHWFNDDKQGIHIESFLMLDPNKRKKSYVTIHVLHHEKIPGTNLKRTEISKPFVDSIYKEVSKWKGYTFRTGKYGTQPFTKIMDGTNDDFEKDLAIEIEKICLVLGPEMERTLKQVLKNS
jgi:hypothetical protein